MLPDAPSHRILIVSDAWHPQVNGVVRTMTTVVGELQAMGHVVEVIGPDRFRTVPVPDLSGHRAVDFSEAQAGPHDRGRSSRTRCISPPRDRSASPRGVGRCAPDFVSPPRSIPGSPNICRREPAFRCARSMPGCGGFTTPAPARWSPRSRCATNSPRAASARSGPGRAVSIWICSSRSRARTGTCRGRSSFTSDGWRSRRTSALSSISICRARRSWSAAGRNWRRCAGTIPRSPSPARGTGRHWRAPTPAPTCSCSPA